MQDPAQIYLCSWRIYCARCTDRLADRTSDQTFTLHVVEYAEVMVAMHSPTHINPYESLRCMRTLRLTRHTVEMAAPITACSDY